jgi:flagellar motor switch/type III secretory pathway protein FliN
MTAKFSGYPFERLPHRTRREAALESAVARWIGACGEGAPRLERLVGVPIRAEVVPPSASFDADAARCEVRIAGASFEVRGASAGVRAIAQRVLGGPAELAAPRPLGIVEESIWSLVVATALEDLGIAGEVWPCGPRSSGSAVRVGLAVGLGGAAMTVEILVPPELDLRVPPTRVPAWADRAKLDVPVVLGRCAIARTDLERLAVRHLVTLDRPAAGVELEILGGVVGVRAAPGAVVVEVATGYIPRDMSLPDDAHVELTVALGTTQLSLRQVFELSIGQVVSLGRPLAGPFELRAAGRVVGKGELVDVDGELAVRIVSLGGD